MNRDFAVKFDADIMVGKPLTTEAFRNAQRRHNDIVHAAKKRDINRREVERAIEDTKYFEFPRREEELKKLNQPGRWSKHPGHGKPGWKKRNYRADIQDEFDKLDAKEEERYLGRSRNFARFLMEQEAIADKADELLDEFEERVRRNERLQTVLWDDCIPFGDFNDPKVVYFVDNDAVGKFRRHMSEEGAALWLNPDYDGTWKTVHVVGVRTFRKRGLVIKENEHPQMTRDELVRDAYAHVRMFGIESARRSMTRFYPEKADSVMKAAINRLKREFPGVDVESTFA